MRNQEAAAGKVHEREESKEEGERRKKPKKVFIYGNYKSYYGYRIDNNAKEDPRLILFKREWFEGKDCLDIGCNEGLITISIAKKFFCQSILGVDIDAGLVETAYWNLRRLARTTNGHNKSKDASRTEDSIYVDHLISDDSSNVKSSDFGSHLPVEELFKRVSFRRENFVESLQGCTEKYDTILCLSVTKWVHLNWGDDGLITLFAKIWRLLRQGGMLILEAQPWSSYKRNRGVSQTAKSNFNSICLRPEGFREILLDKIGFKSADIITDSLSGAAVGFDRPVVMFCK
ncbi:probable RNA methyltransferase At5g51130 [Zingiber officinale]|uniref:probable RNA methyltransferase At5g51130 n=1 Tax=Zingiber officinale TaxID=94328 RepID=UPI001C4DA9FF|nr:probable RNA methyltransferase At5g51130 [Zingiber officinale]